MMRLISVITTTKNAGSFIFETLEGVRNQSFKEIEHIVVDDDSNDSTVSIIKEYQKAHSEYCLKLYQPGNLGRGKALEYGVSKAASDWVAIIDADDIWHPLKLEVQADILRKQKIDVLGTSTKLFSKIDDLDFLDVNRDDVLIFLSLKDFLTSNRISHSSVVMRKSLCQYDTGRKSQFDYELWLRLAENNAIIANTKSILNFHRIHSRQSFEANMKKAYYWRSYRLKASKCISNRDVKSLLYNSFKLFLDLALPRSIRLQVRSLLRKY